LGPFHGLPISIKACEGIAGLDNTAGFVGWVGRKNVEDATIVKIFWKRVPSFMRERTEPQGLVSHSVADFLQQHNVVCNNNGEL
jgi:hypothetical protein